MHPAGDYLVYVRDGLSRVLWDETPAPAGWTEVARVADHRAGWTIAALEHACLPDDYDNPMGGRAISEPVTLYRSVSLPELRDILESGEVRGGGNRFTGFDRRPFVFFSSGITPRVIWQGDEIDRCTAHEANAFLTSIDLEFDGFKRQIRTQCRKAWDHLMSGSDKSMEAQKRRRRAESITFDWENFQAKAWSDAFWLELLPEREVKVKIAEFARRREAVVEEHKSRLPEIMETLERLREEVSYSSAIIETRPVNFGMHFSQSFGSSGMGEEDEYGLFSGQIKLDDIVAVHWVRDRQITDVTGLSAAEELLRTRQSAPAPR